MKKGALYTISGKSFIAYDDGYLDGAFIITDDRDVYGFCREQPGHPNSFMDYAVFVIVGVLRSENILGELHNDNLLDFVMLTDNVDESVLPLYQGNINNYKAVACNLVEDTRDDKRILNRLRGVHYMPTTPETYYADNTKQYTRFHWDFICRELACSQALAEEILNEAQDYAHGSILDYYREFISMFKSWEKPAFETSAV